MATTHNSREAAPPGAELPTKSRTRASVPVPIGAILAAATVALLGAAWFRSRSNEAALRERTAERLRSRLEVN